MARTITDEEIKLSIIINGNPAQKQLLDLEKDTRKLTEANKDLKLERKRLELQGKKDTVEYKKLTAEITANTTEIDNNKAVMKELQNQIGLTGLTIAQLTSKAGQLRMSLRNVIPGSDDYKQYEAELRQVNDRLSELNGRARQSRFSLGSLADSFNRYAALGASVIATLTGVVLSIQKIIDYNGKLSDTQADVMKTTGMTRKEVDELTKSFGLLQTRTSRIDLLKIAEQGGRIGIAKEEIGSFVEVMNKASVSLGDSFTGGVEEVANKLGKLKFLFQETKDMSVDQAYNSIGSAINDLGANGVASEANIADFATRIGSLTDVLKPTIRETLALGAAFEESGIESEVSARAYNIFMKQASTESAKFAQVMGLSQKSIEGMINTNPLEFMLKFAEGMRGMDATETAKTLDFLGINADGANKVIGAMGNNMGRFRELIDLSNNSFKDGSSLVTEYNIKNETLGATLEKIKKTVTGWFSSETFVKWLTTSVQWLSEFIGASASADGTISKFKDKLIIFIKILAIVITSYVSYNAAIKLTSLWTNTLSAANTILNAIQNRGAVITGLLRSAQLFLAAAYYTVTGNTVRAAAAMRLFNATVATNPIGLLLAVLASAYIAYRLFSNEVTTATKVQRALAEVHDEATQNISKEKNELELLAKIAKDERVSKEKRLEAISKLNEIIPDYIGNLTLENIKTAEGISILQKYTAELYKNARAKSVQKKFDELSDQKLKVESSNSTDFGGTVSWLGQDGINFKNRNELNEYIIKNYADFINLKTDKQTGARTFDKKAFETLVSKFLKMSGLNNKESEISDLDAQMKALESELTQNKINELGANPKEGDTKSENGATFKYTGGKWVKVKSKFSSGGNEGVGESKKDPNSSKSDIEKMLLEDQVKYNEMSLRLRRQLEDSKIAAMLDGYEKEKAIENLRYQREIQDLDRKKIKEEEFAKLENEILKAKENKDVAKEKALYEIKRLWGERNKDLDAKINAIEANAATVHQFKLGTIRANAEKKRIEDFQKNFERAKLLRETAYNNELSLLGNNEAAKEKLKKEFDKKEYEATKAHLESLISLLETQMSIDNAFNIIDPKRQKEISDQIDFLKNKISELPRPGEAQKETFGQAAKSAFGDTDILGFSASQWDSTFANLDTLASKLAATNMVVTGMQNLWSSFSNFQTASENRNLSDFQKNADKKKLTLKRQLDNGYINKSQYDKQIKKIDEDYEKRKAEVEYKQAKREKAMALVSAIINTAKGISAAIPNPFLMSLAAIVGGLQIATIAKQPLPAKGYEQGLYPDYVKREQDGKIFQSTGTSPMQSGLFSKPRILVGEGPGSGPEMVIDKKAYAQIPPNIKNALINSLRGIKGFENGYYNQDKMRIEVPAGSTPAPGSSNDAMMEMNMAVMAETLAVLKDLRENPLIAMVSNKDYKSMKNLLEGLEDYKKLIEKTKR